MTTEQQILSLLSRKKELFLELEEVTANMCILPLEELSLCTDKRGTLLDKIQTTDLEIKALCSQDRDIVAALNNTCEREGLSGELGALFDASISVKAVVNRIIKNEDSIRMHLTMEKQKIAEKMEELAHSGEAVAEKYHKSVLTGQNHPFAGANDKMI